MIDNAARERFEGRRRFVLTLAKPILTIDERGWHFRAVGVDQTKPVVFTHESPPSL